MADQTVYKKLQNRVKELEEAIAMADNRLEAALMGEKVCEHCVELARSYLSPHVGEHS